ncbi:hypothetical protein D9611_008633 [Ephemerocybe angulata]|uniref:Transcription activator GCR1-like domain-containing protein n=1 Tax=Ephemerocybe angulata TaxID=980116 RepID=A0A8H5AYM0_9AGAR|nr:hypothetical protein D9611_008633 [Tulosesus angulatus]
MERYTVPSNPIPSTRAVKITHAKRVHLSPSPSTHLTPTNHGSTHEEDISTSKSPIGVTPRTPAISGSGTVYPYATFPLSTKLETRAAQVREISLLEKKISEEKLKHNAFEWVEDSPNRGASEWLPVFHGYWKPSSHQTPSLKDIWMENEYGIGQCFSIKELKQHWGVRWRRNTNGLKVEGVRRDKVVDLVRRLIAQDGWDEERALRFLKEKCDIPSKSAPYLKNLRAFITFLGSDKNSGIQKIIDSSVGFS